MSTLADYISVSRPDLRSVSLERDLGSADPLVSYSPPISAMQLLEGINGACSPGPRLRSWSVIGPYGAGKSTFAHLVAAVLGRTDDTAYATALKAIRGVDRSLANSLGRTRTRLGLGEEGMILACVTAQDEPLSLALARALEQGGQRYWGHRRGRRPSVLSEVEGLSRSPEKSRGKRVVEAFESLAAHAPVLLILDEFGKLLENEASAQTGELYALQLLAERVSNAAEFNGLIVTLQHLSFEESTADLPPAARAEWRKIEGRFEPRLFDANPSHAAALIARALNQRSLPKSHSSAAAKRIERFGAAASAAGIPREILGDLGTYPLHPLVPPVAAALAGRLGQHDRSLAAFIASDAPDSLAWTLRRTEASATKPTFVGLDKVYDYFVTAASLNDLRAGGERYREIHDRILEADRLSELQFAILKAIGALNLAGGSDLRASRKLLELAFVDGRTRKTEVADAIKALVASGLVTYRRFADEYRVWEGSDFDIAARIDERRQRLVAAESGRDVLLRLAVEREPARPVVARRHSHEHRTLRYFEARYASALEALDAELKPESDGLLVYLLGERPEGVPAETADGRPLVVVVAGSLRRAEQAALELAATIEAAEQSPELDRDAIARGEMRHRLAGAQQAFAAALREALDPARRDVDVVARGERLRKVAAHGGLERLLSDLCDQTYSKTPALNSEMLNRRELSSQGAKARRALIEAMFEHAGDELLGFSGYGPERAMLGSALVATGLYRKRGDECAFGPPSRRSTLHPAWQEVMNAFDGAERTPMSFAEIYRRVQAPPFGMKAGPLPVLMAAALLHRDEDVMLFEAGSYVPRIGPEHFERLIKTPERFTIKRLPAAALRGEVFARIGDAVGVSGPSGADSRNQGALAVLRPMISVVRGLSEYARHTRRVSAMAQRVRTVLLETREPDRLLFEKLPEACEVEPLGADADPEVAGRFSSRLGESLLELADAQRALTRHIEGVLAEVFELDRGRLRNALAEQAAGVERHVIEPKMRSFVLLAQEDSMEDPDWLEGVAMNLVDRPPESWSDADIATFEAAAAERARWLKRLRLLFREQGGDREPAPQLTLTLADGREASRLLDAPPELHEAVSSAVDGMLSSLRDEHGPEAATAVLAVLAQRLLEIEENDDAQQEGHSGG